MGINAKNIKELVIEPTLHSMGGGFLSNSAVNLLLMTCAAESKCGTYLKQGLRKLDDGRGVARGIYQMEPFTHDDIQKRFKWSKILSEDMTCYRDAKFNLLITDLKYATVMARVKYSLTPEKMPVEEATEALATYYAKHWYAGPYQDDRKEKAIKAYKAILNGSNL